MFYPALLQAHRFDVLIRWC